MKIDDKELSKLMKQLGFVYKKLTKHTIVFSNGVHDLSTSKTTSDKARRLKNVRASLKRLGYTTDKDKK